MPATYPYHKKLWEGVRDELVTRSSTISLHLGLKSITWFYFHLRTCEKYGYIHKWLKEITKDFKKY